MTKFSRIVVFFVSFFLYHSVSEAQINAVTFGKNRIQYKKKKWQFYQSDNFNVYFYDKGQEIAKYTLQTAEKVLHGLEAEAEYSLQRRTNIIVFNHFADFEQTNIGLESDIINTGGNTQLVNNKMLVYFTGDHEQLKKQIKQGIAEILTKNILFGDNIGEVAGNQTLLDLPRWFTDGYQAYLGEHWSTSLDDELKSEILSGNYTKFSSLAFKLPVLTGHAFWYYFEEKYGAENISYFFNLAKAFKNINKACLQITNKKLSEVTAEFMEYQDEKYQQDIAKRKAYPKGSLVDAFDINTRLNYYRFNVNPLKRNNSYVVTRFKKGIMNVIYNDGDRDISLLKYGIKSLENEINPNYPLMAWDPKGVKIAVVYSEQSRLKLFVYHTEQEYRQFKTDLTDTFDQIQDIKYMLDNRTLLLSAVKNGHTDIFSFDTETEKIVQITNDIYDDIDPAFVSFPNKTGILFASNRPNANAVSSDEILPDENRYNIFMITNFGDKPELNQITQLSNVKFGSARFPSQYNNNHFTFVSDENGIGNRYAGFFTTKNMGLDTLVLISGNMLRNPTQQEIDSALSINKKSAVDSIAYVTITADSAYTFPLTNYQSSLSETRTAGDERILSEVTRQSDQKNLYKLKIDEQTLTKRNVPSTPTAYRKRLMEMEKGNSTPALTPMDSARRKAAEFQTEFEDNYFGVQTDNKAEQKSDKTENSLAKAKLFRYLPIKFSADAGSIGPNNTLLFNRFQKYAGGSGPINLNGNSPLNGMITMSTSDVMEDLHILGALKMGSNFKENEWLFNFQNLRRRFDWGATLYRNVVSAGVSVIDQFGQEYQFPAKLITNLYQGNISYAFDKARSIRFSSALRSDNLVVSNVDEFSSSIDNIQSYYSLNHLEYVYDNCLNRANNIWDGLRYKAYIDFNREVNNKESALGANTYNFGFEARYYYPIYRNFIWAGRAAADVSWGDQKLIYYLGGMDGWLMFGDNIKPGTNRERFFNSRNVPDGDQSYAFQSLAVNMRGFIQNAANGNNAIVMNSEFRLPVVSTFFDKTVNNTFLRDLQLTQFIDIGTAWNGAYDKWKRPVNIYNSPDGSGNNGPMTITQKAGGIGPFLVGYGFGARSTLFGYFLKYDVGWPMVGFFKGRPVMYLSMGLDF